MGPEMPSSLSLQNIPALLSGAENKSSGPLDDTVFFFLSHEILSLTPTYPHPLPSPKSHTESGAANS